MQTRDIVDGMGVTGVEGVFRRCCEETLIVLREHRNALMTIVDVFLHDPLFIWSMTPSKALNAQRMASEENDDVSVDVSGLILRPSLPCLQTISHLLTA